MPTGVLSKAGAGIALALVFALSCWVFPGWGPVIIPVVGGLYFSALFVRVYVHEPPSLPRFRKLSFYAMGTVSGLILGTVAGISRLPLGLNFLQRAWIMLAASLTILAGLMAFSVWQVIAVYNYDRRRTPPNPDFEEDAEGNPVRPRDPDAGPGA
jgi:hypothetical protein